MEIVRGRVAQWITDLDLSNRQMLAAYLASKNDHLGLIKACERDASVVGFNGQTVRRWVKAIAAEDDSECDDVPEKRNGPFDFWRRSFK